MRAVGYVRVSLEEERPENQVLAIQDYCARNGIELVEIFQDIGVSGAKPALERSGFRQMLEFCDRNSIRLIVVYDVTRLGRDSFDLVSTMNELIRRGFYVIFIEDPELSIDPRLDEMTLAHRKSIFLVKAAASELEHAFLRRRTRQGMRRAWLEGKLIGRRPKSGRHVTPELYAKIVEMCREGMLKSEIARRLSLSLKQVYYWVKKYEAETGTKLNC